VVQPTLNREVQDPTRLRWLWIVASCLPTLRTLPSCSRKPALFGLVVSDLREAWQSVSTISHLRLELHKHSPDGTKTIWAVGEWLCDLPIIFLSKNDKVFPDLFWKYACVPCKTWDFGSSTLSILHAVCSISPDPTLSRKYHGVTPIHRFGFWWVWIWASIHVGFLNPQHYLGSRGPYIHTQQNPYPN
jgi:hypothetical protein